MSLIGSCLAIYNMVHIIQPGVVLIYILSTFGPDFTTAYGNGAPSKICDSMIPGHGKAQRSLAPYTIKVSESSFSPGGTLSVTIVGDKYSGMMLQARHPGTTTPVGTFSGFPYGTKPMDCSAPKDSVTHSIPTSKASSAVYTWTAPPGVQKDIYFVATLARFMNTWWINLQSEVITLRRPTTPSTTSTTPSTTTTPIPTTTTAIATTTTTHSTKMESTVTSLKAHGTTVQLEVIMNDREIGVNETIISNDVDVIGEWGHEPIVFSTKISPVQKVTKVTNPPLKDDKSDLRKEESKGSIPPTNKSPNCPGISGGSLLSLLIVWSLRILSL